MPDGRTDGTDGRVTKSQLVSHARSVVGNPNKLSTIHLYTDREKGPSFFFNAGLSEGQIDTISCPSVNFVSE